MVRIVGSAAPSEEDQDQVRRAAEQLRSTAWEAHGGAEKLKEDIKELVDTCELLEELRETTRKKIMVPLGPLAFAPGELVHTNEYLVLVGDNYFLERTASQACATLQRRKKGLEEKQRLLEQERDVYLSQYDFAVNSMNFQTQMMGFGGDDIVDIREAIQEEDEDESEALEEDHDIERESHGQGSWRAMAEDSQIERIEKSTFEFESLLRDLSEDEEGEPSDEEETASVLGEGSSVPRSAAIPTNPAEIYEIMANQAGVSTSAKLPSKMSKPKSEAFSGVIQERHTIPSFGEPKVGSSTEEPSRPKRVISEIEIGDNSISNTDLKVSKFRAERR